MPKVLMLVDKPAHADSAQGAAAAQWNRFVAATYNVHPPLNEKAKLSENVWLLDLEKELAALAEMIHAARKERLSYRTLLIEGEPVELK